jgi:uncharacterized protein (DUF1800 family)
MELHTLGVDGGYTQQDVIELARIMTGWAHGGLADSPEYKFHPDWHDKGKKSLLGHEFPAGGGEDEGVRAIELLCKHPATARFVATKLVRFFVSDSPPQALVDKVAARFTKSDGDLREVYRELFTAPEFWSAAGTPKIKRPYEFVVSAIRALDGQVTPDIAKLRPLEKMLSDLGEPTFRCASPTGYRDDPRFWVNPGSMILRMKTSAVLASGRAEGIQLPATAKAQAKQKVLLLASSEFQNR